MRGEDLPSSIARFVASAANAPDGILLLLTFRLFINLQIFGTVNAHKLGLGGHGIQHQ